MKSIASKTITAAMARNAGTGIPVLEFFVYPEGPQTELRGKNAFIVKVFSSKKELQDERALCWPRRKPVPIWGFTHEYHRPHRFLIGSVNLYLRSVTDNVVAHEMWHATMWWAHRIGLDPSRMATWRDSVHERCAEAHGEMVSQFWRRFTEVGYERRECWGFRAQSRQVVT